MKRSGFILACFLFCFSLPQNLSGQTSKDYALFFAVNEYENMRDLRNPIQNARDIAKILQADYSFETEILENPTLVQIEDKIREYRNLFASNPDGKYSSDGQLLIFFTGHGAEELEEGYFMPKDVNPDLVYRTGLSYTYWRKFINTIDCQHIMVVIDACHSVTFDPAWQAKADFNFERPGELSEGQKLRTQHQKIKSRIFFTSDGKGDQTPDKSDFAKKLQEGLLHSGGRDGIVTSTDIFASLKRAFPTPHGGEFGDDEPGSSFLFIKADVNTARTRADLQAWEDAQKAETIDAYQDYLKSYPDGDFAIAAKNRLEKFSTQQRVENAIKRETEAWQRTKNLNTEEAYIQYLSDYPDGKYRVAAATSLEALRLLNNQNTSSPVNTASGKDLIPQPKMIFVPGGSFDMGSEEYANARPVHKVNIKGFYLGETEVTNEQYAAFLNAKQPREDLLESWINLNGNYVSEFGEKCRILMSGKTYEEKEYKVESGFEKFPVIYVRWAGAYAYCKWLSELNGEDYRLPSESEWEYAAGGGANNRTRWAGTNNESELSQYAVFETQHTSPVKSKMPNKLGLYDMIGNVWEWCADKYSSDFEDLPNDGSIYFEGSESNIVIRGGGWHYYKPDVKYRASHILVEGLSSKRSQLGFRVSRSITSQSSNETDILPLPKMIKIEGGSFEMGSYSGKENEKPAHKVNIRSFYLGETVITNKEYQSFLQAMKPSEEEFDQWIDYGNDGIYYINGIISKSIDDYLIDTGYENNPVTRVTWKGAIEYCKWLSEITGEEYRLPSEAEWEYAAGGGAFNRTKWFGTNDPSEIKKYSLFGPYRPEIAPVKIRMPNQLGLYGMGGNVSEWCSDIWDSNYDGVPSDGTARVFGDNDYYVVRGEEDSAHLYITYRSYNSITSTPDRDQSFRVARSIPVSELPNPLDQIPLPEMIPIKGGKFIMGNNDNEDEKPEHQVNVKDFHLGETEVTNEQYCAFLNVRGNQQEGENHWLVWDWQYGESGIQKVDQFTYITQQGFENNPVRGVTWYGARAYCQWLSDLTGESYRLPTEAEWEYAAGGGEANRTKWPGAKNKLDLLRYAVTGKLTSVKSKKPNQLGLYDMAGNVIEWCSDLWKENYEGVAISPAPGGPAEMAGLIAGDVILFIDNYPIFSFEDLDQAKNNYKSETRVQVRFKREGKIKTVDLQLKHDSQRDELILGVYSYGKERIIRGVGEMQVTNRTKSEPDDWAGIRGFRVAK